MHQCVYWKCIKLKKKTLIYKIRTYSLLILNYKVYIFSKLSTFFALIIQLKMPFFTILCYSITKILQMIQIWLFLNAFLPVYLINTRWTSPRNKIICKSFQQTLSDSKTNLLSKKFMWGNLTVFVSVAGQFLPKRVEISSITKSNINEY